jgi:hypothetical protein
VNPNSPGFDTSITASYKQRHDSVDNFHDSNRFHLTSCHSTQGRWRESSRRDLRFGLLIIGLKPVSIECSLGQRVGYDFGNAFLSSLTPAIRHR